MVNSLVMAALAAGGGGRTRAAARAVACDQEGGCVTCTENFLRRQECHGCCLQFASKDHSQQNSYTYITNMVLYLQNVYKPITQICDISGIYNQIESRNKTVLNIFLCVHCCHNSDIENLDHRKKKNMQHILEDQITYISTFVFVLWSFTI